MILKLEIIEKNMEIFHHVFEKCFVVDASGSPLTCYSVEEEGTKEISIPDVLKYEIRRGAIVVYRKLYDAFPYSPNMRKIRRLGDSIGQVL